MKNFLAILATVLILGCSDDEEQLPKIKLNTDNADYKVLVLFEVDGCKVYRFRDGWNDRYFTNCQGNVSWTEKRGKSSYEMEVPTNTK